MPSEALDRPFVMIGGPTAASRFKVPAEPLRKKPSMSRPVRLRRAPGDKRLRRTLFHTDYPLIPHAQSRTSYVKPNGTCAGHATAFGLSGDPCPVLRSVKKTKRHLSRTRSIRNTGYLPGLSISRWELTNLAQVIFKSACPASKTQFKVKSFPCHRNDFDTGTGVEARHRCLDSVSCCHSAVWPIGIFPHHPKCVLLWRVLRKCRLA